MDKKSVNQLANEKSQRILDGVAAWCAFYRENPQRFVADYLNVTLKTFQKFLIYAMMHNTHFMFWAARSLGKTWLTALFCVIRCILFPKTKICVCSSTRGQANEVLSKITDDFMKNYEWGSENLKREISYYSIGANKAIIEFANGSWIQVVTASDTGRSKRANVIVIDEFRMVDKHTINTVIKRFLGAPREPNYLNRKEYRKDRDKLLETNIEIYMSSCWLKSHWSYNKSKAFTANLLGGRDGYFVCALPYQMSVKEGLKKRVEIEDEMSEQDFDEMLFEMEMGCMPFGSTESAFFSFDDINDARRLQTAVYSPQLIYKNKGTLLSEIPDLLPNERRILSLDIALMSSKKNKNDASSVIINRAIPVGVNSYMANIIYLENFEDITTNQLALIVRRMFKQFKCTDLVVDTNGQGLGVYDNLIIDIVDNETGELYPALSCCNNKEMEERCKVANAPKVIWSIKATPAFNNEICLLLRNGFKQNKINLLISEFECDDILSDKITGYKKLLPYEQELYKLPYTQTTLLVYELVKLEYERNGANIRVFEQSGMRKDRYSSLAYNYWVQCELERQELRKPKYGTDDIVQYAKKFKNLNKRPRTY